MPLDSLGVLRVRGADSVSFLQGQLSNDLRLLGCDRALFAGYHNPQGRVIALLRLLQLGGDDLLAILPRERVAPLLQRLGKFVLRSKVKLSDESGHWFIQGLIGHANVALATVNDGLPDAVNEVTHRDGTLAVCIAQQPARWLLVSPASQTPRPPGTGPVESGPLWERLAIAAGEPEIYSATSEGFVAQMLNLDALGAIAFDKGCYTGQEIIARAHYRGRVKRRMQRFLTEEPAQLMPGDNGTLSDGRSFRVVRVALHDDGRCEFLAVTQAGGAGGAGGAEDAAATSDAHPAAGSETAPAPSRRLSARALELPYSVPD
jgi:tRNA-modifying protein YgfZ